MISDTDILIDELRQRVKRLEAEVRRLQSAVDAAFVTAAMDSCADVRGRVRRALQGDV